MKDLGLGMYAVGESPVCTSTAQVVPCKMEYSETRMRTEDVEGVMDVCVGGWWGRGNLFFRNN